MKQKSFFLMLLPATLLFSLLVLFISAKNFLAEKPGCHCVPEALSGEFQSGEKTASFEGKTIVPPLAARPAISSQEQRVLGEQTGEKKWIEIDLSEQKIRAWEGNNLFLESLISSGKWGATPTGEYRIWSKFKYTKMSGGKKELHTYYYLPNVPYTMYFNGDIGLHGTYWHNNFGQPMSHGCVNLPTPVAEKLFYWSTPQVDGLNAVSATKNNPGTRVVVHE